MTTATPQHLSGTTSWVGPDNLRPVLTSTVTNNSITFEIGGPGLPYPYVIELAPAPQGPPWWRGTWTRTLTGETGYVEAKRYDAADGGIALVGRWLEADENHDHKDDTWFTELRP